VEQYLDGLKTGNPPHLTQRDKNDIKESFNFMIKLNNELPTKFTSLLSAVDQFGNPKPTKDVEANIKLQERSMEMEESIERFFKVLNHAS